MSGYSEARDCPRCGSTESLEHSQDDDYFAGFCHECGYGYSTKFSLASLEEVNDERKAYELEPLTELRSPVEGWAEEKDDIVVAKQEAKQETIQAFIDYLKHEIATQDERTAGAPHLKAHLDAVEVVIFKVLIGVLEESLRFMTIKQEESDDNKD